ncbi:putative conjugal transfer protein TrbI family protein [Selenomonas ruminantium subsp. lactilytica TAM6421]|uniref:Putative conjugal transfer protein TrbI family protein n=1 Tax=Selenomonas ruminantium subsp. lactilytica (strain NBRC 103574 / TAM6421) TaxID=927704 RepID=I0GQF9_SELRL|nr:TrbI/VirB10 family protein [Selenomonas ruminantium]BAL82996.1 putative conjugal transfer protein TrbI family protein [Selenomonas ruminantium subsp. lactilytica TAM6421]
MSGIKELRDGLAKKMSAMKEKQGKSELTNPSMAEGVNEKAYGLRKKVVYGIVLFLVSAFLSFSYFGMGSDEPQEKKTKQTDQAADANNMVNSDRQLQQMNNRVKNPNGMSPGAAPPMEGGKGTNGTAQNNARGNMETAEQGNGQRGADNNARYPVIPQRSYSGSYSSPYPVPLPLNPVKQAPQPKKEKEDYSASIAFAGDYGKDTKSADKPAETNEANLASKTGQQAFAGTSYMELTPNSLQAGTVIPAVLLTGINTDVGGQVMAQIESDVYDSLTGTQLLIPAGSRLVGTIGQGAKEGQNRVSVSWQTLIMPSGGSYTLGGSMIAADMSGYGGIPGRAHHHSGSLLRSGFFTSAVAALGAIASGNTSTTTNTYTAGQLAGQGAMSNLMNTASALIQKGVNNAGTTITVEAGKEFMVYVTMPVQFNPY